MAVTIVRYGAEGWGVGEIWLEDGRVVYHELPTPRPDDGRSRSGHPLADRLAAYFAGERVSFADVELDLGWCTPFQHALADALRAVPYGETVTYGELAASAGYPAAQRAAGTFCARNRFPVVLPCHRVVSSSGIGGFGSLGDEYKRRMLALEGSDAAL